MLALPDGHNTIAHRNPVSNFKHHPPAATSAAQALANPPFKDSSWSRNGDDTRTLFLSTSIPFSASDGEKVAQPDEVLPESGKRARVRCRNDLPPKVSANFDYLTILHSAFGFRHLPHLTPQGMAGFVLANGMN